MGSIHAFSLMHPMKPDTTPRPDPFQPDFNRSIHVVPAEQPLSSDGGAVFLRDFEDRLKVVDTLAERLVDPRDPRLCKYTLADLIRILAVGFGAAGFAAVLAARTEVRL